MPAGYWRIGWLHTFSSVEGQLYTAALANAARTVSDTQEAAMLLDGYCGRRLAGSMRSPSSTISIKKCMAAWHWKSEHPKPQKMNCRRPGAPTNWCSSGVPPKTPRALALVLAWPSRRQKCVQNARLASWLALINAGATGDIPVRSEPAQIA